MSVPSTPENSSSYLLEASFWIQSLHSRVIACFTKLNNYTGMKSPYSGVTITASEEQFNSIAVQGSLSQKLRTVLVLQNHSFENKLKCSDGKILSTQPGDR